MGFEPSVRVAARLVRDAKRGWALTGAGVSTHSGIPDFRGPNGLWQKFDPEIVASIEGFYLNPSQFYDFWLWRFERMASAKPNPVHEFLAWLEGEGKLFGVITQNIDGLHQKAGSRRVLEVHGHTRSGTCMSCGHFYPWDWIAAEARRTGLARCKCSGLVKPDVVLFGEPMSPDFDHAQREVAQADLLFVLGSSLTVWPAAGLVPLARSCGARIIIANGEPTPFDGLSDACLRGDLVEVVGALRRILELDGAFLRDR